MAQDAGADLAKLARNLKKVAEQQRQGTGNRAGAGGGVRKRPASMMTPSVCDDAQHHGHCVVDDLVEILGFCWILQICCTGFHGFVL